MYMLHARVRLWIQYVEYVARYSGIVLHVMHISCNASYMLHVPLHIDGFTGYISLVIAP